MILDTPSVLSGPLLVSALLTTACGTDQTVVPSGSSPDAAVVSTDAAIGADAAVVDADTATGPEAGENTDSGEQPDAANALDNEDNLRTWANSVSALAVYLLFHEELAFANEEHTYADPACPVVDDDDTTVTISGDCTDEEGRQWVGSVTIVRSDDGDRELSFFEFGSSVGSEEATTKDGTVSVRRVDEALHEFDVNLVHAGEITTTVEYTGSVAGGYAGSTVWNGSGTSLRQGPMPPIGRVAANTVAQVVDGDVCSGQPASGQTTISNEEHVVVVTYDGASDCDDAQAARFSVDGQDRGPLDGIACTMRTPGRGGWSWSALGALSLLLAASIRLPRRGQRRGQP